MLFADPGYKPLNYLDPSLLQHSYESSEEHFERLHELLEDAVNSGRPYDANVITQHIYRNRCTTTRTRQWLIDVFLKTR